MSQFFRTLLGQSHGVIGSPIWTTGAINHTKVGTTDHVDFPVWFSGTYAQLADVAHGGQLNSVDEFGFFSNPDGSGLLDAQRISHDLTTGTVRYWFRMPAISHTTDSLFYPAKVSGSSDLMNPSGVWSSGFKSVIHTGDGITLGLTDSTENANSFTTNNGGVTATAGKLYGAANFAGTSPKYLSAATAFITGYPLTVSFWFNLQTGLGNGETRFFGAIGDPANTNNLLLSIFSPAFSGSTYIGAHVNNGASTWRWGPTVSIGSWEHAMIIFEDNHQKDLIYNGSLISPNASDNNDLTPVGMSATYLGGSIANGSFSGQLVDLLEEPRYYAGIRSPSWGLAEFNNQNDPSTFYTLT